MSEAFTLTAAAQLGQDGRCCGRKPLPYKRKERLFCPRCDRAYSIHTGKQIDSFSWWSAGEGFRPQYDPIHYPDNPGLTEYVSMPGPTGYLPYGCIADD